MERLLKPLAAFLAVVIPLFFIVGLEPVGRARAAGESNIAVDARIERVWPHDVQGEYESVNGAPLVNVLVYLFQRGTLNPVSCSFDNTVTLRWAQNWTSHVGLPIPNSPRGRGSLIPEGTAAVFSPSGVWVSEVVGQKVVVTENGRSFPAWEFNDVPVEPAYEMGGTVTTYFTVAVDGADYHTSVWAHGVDSRTLGTPPPPPMAVVSPNSPSTVEALIPIVWPHDAENHPEPVAAAPLVNVAVDLAQHPSDFGHSRWTALGSDFSPEVTLYRSLNNGYLEPLPIVPRIVTAHDSYASTPVSWPRYEFDDVDVSAAQDPANTYFFAVSVDGVMTDSVIWAHGANARTYFPMPDVPTTSGVGC